jgi:hypothetical protein
MGRCHREYPRYGPVGMTVKTFYVKGYIDIVSILPLVLYLRSIRVSLLRPAIYLYCATEGSGMRSRCHLGPASDGMAMGQRAVDTAMQ